MQTSTTVDAVKVRIEIEDALEELPRAYGDEMYAQKCSSIFEHVYESYYGEGGSVFSAGA